MDRSRIGVVIPALNEAATIESIVLNVCQYGTPIVVDDGSCDNTGVLAVGAGAIVVKHAVNRGYDQALNSGFLCALNLNCEYVITIDADGQHDSSILALFINALDNGADLVIGVRDHRQRIAEHIFAWISYWIWKVRDPLCGMKGYRIELYKELGHFDSYNSIGTELALFAAAKGKRVAQIYMKTRGRIDTPRFGGRISANVRIMRALWRAIQIRIHASNPVAFR